jgi:hypothetical protein
MPKMNKPGENNVDVTKNAGTPGTAAFVPDEQAILKELKQREVRKAYMTTDKAKANRKTYQQKRYLTQAATRDAIKNLKDTDPVKYNEMMAKVQADIAAKKK